ncbi:uncharacterized protein LOC6735479 [Drosophila simulans]|uniref:GD25231 n=1 Tax=Drosophila simulans TaxID=7240 RepID=B4QFL1_DROSI|nr:uncharacterized protein LOC6735479 [Drosophila simulans]EDX08003.1 GD25231 [Drosophila simulans]KMY95426.1 uncharacterized protein Dsimw501_GD25231 [Drosophila simulans]
MVGLKFPSNRTLGNICVYGAVASISAVMYMKWKMEDRVKSAEYYKLALKALRSHRGAVGLLGEPIKDSGIDLSNANNNCNAEEARCEVAVRGSKDKGTLYFWASNQPDRGWLIDRLELETKLNPEKRFLLKKSEELTFDLPESITKLPAKQVDSNVILSELDQQPETHSK